jgi:excisionase family DNA binding protein
VQKSEASESFSTARYFTLAQAATYLNVSKPRVYALARSDELAAIKIGGRGIWRMARYKLDQWLEELEKQNAKVSEGEPAQPQGPGRPALGRVQRGEAQGSRCPDCVRDVSPCDGRKRGIDRSRSGVASDTRA